VPFSNHLSLPPLPRFLLQALSHPPPSRPVPPKVSNKIPASLHRPTASCVRALPPLLGVLRGIDAHAIYARQFQKMFDVFFLVCRGRRKCRGAGRPSRPHTHKPCPALPVPRPLFVQLLHASAYSPFHRTAPSKLGEICLARCRPLSVKASKVAQTGPRLMHARTIGSPSFSRAFAFTFSCLLPSSNPPPSPSTSPLHSDLTFAKNHRPVNSRQHPRLRQALLRRYIRAHVRRFPRLSKEARGLLDAYSEKGSGRQG
jgi:hypothetical protein